MSSSEEHRLDGGVYHQQQSLNIPPASRKQETERGDAEEEPAGSPGGALLPEDPPASALLDEAYNSSGHHRHHHGSDMGGSSAGDTPSFSFSTLKLMGEAWKYRATHTSRQKKIMFVFIILTVYTSYMMQFFGINWWLASFPKSDGASSFLQMILPAVVWQLFYTIVTVPYKLFLVAKDENFWFWTPVESARRGTQQSGNGSGGVDEEKKDWRGVKWMVAVGFIDAMGGLTAVYSVPHVAPFMQMVVYSTGTLVTWLLSRLISPEKAPPLNPWLAVSFALSISGILVAGIQQFSTITSQQGGAGWIFIFFLNSAFPNLYNVVQGRFLSHYQSTPRVSHWTAKLLVLLGDTTTQIFFTVAFFPLDSMPWFGSSKNPSETWDHTMAGVRCMFHCKDNFVYFMLYIFGVVLSRTSNAFLNHYSPTLGAFINQFGNPFLGLLLIAIPQWDTFPVEGHWYLQVICLVILLTSSFIYSFYEEACRAHEALLIRRKRGGGGGSGFSDTQLNTHRAFEYGSAVGSSSPPKEGYQEVHSE